MDKIKFYSVANNSLREGESLGLTTVLLRRDYELYVENLQSDISKKTQLLKEIANWLVCSCISTPHDMAQSFEPFLDCIEELLLDNKDDKYCEVHLGWCDGNCILEDEK